MKVIMEDASKCSFQATSSPQSLDSRPQMNPSLKGYLQPFQQVALMFKNLIGSKKPRVEVCKASLYTESS
ncbi:mCG1035271 [Mus musculus]|nr:mCG1035271 [Mus musculus]